MNIKSKFKMYLGFTLLLTLVFTAPLPPKLTGTW